MTEKKMALLIDAENTSAKYIDVILNELKEYGIITYQRMYGDFSRPEIAEWNKKALEYAIVPIQQPRYSSAKNAADIMLVIDAMDILYTANVDGFCIVTSDSDFTRLVNRLRENGMFIIGMGQSNASKAFITACNEYKFLDKISEEEANIEISEEKENSSVTPLRMVKAAINEIVQLSQNKGERANLGGTKSRLQRLYPDFDERNYGYTSFQRFISEATKFIVEQEGHSVYIVKQLTSDTETKVKEFIIKEAKKNIELGLLGTELHNKYPEFKYKDYGYAQLKKYVSSIKEVTIKESKNKNKIVCLK